MAETNLAIDSSSDNSAGINQGIGFNFDLDFFSGPLDLLLHLVRTEEVSIEEVQMSVIADKYLAIIQNSKFIDLERAAEYLVIASTLMAIKSDSVLSKNISVSDEEDTYQSTEFYEQLRERLKQYELTKLRAEKLRALPQLNIDTWARQDKNALKLSNDEIFFEKSDTSFLVSAFMSLFQKVGEAAKTFLVRFESISVVDYMMKIVDDVTIKKSLNLSSLIKKYLVAGEVKDAANVRGVVVGSFIAMLELVKRGVILVSQNDQNDEILINEANSEQPLEKNALTFDSEFDAQK